MGLLFGDTHYHSETVYTTSPGQVDATNKLARANEDLSKSTGKLADAINEDKVKITHTRYAELINKDRKLKAIEDYIHTRFLLLEHVVMTEQYKDYRKMYIMNPDRMKSFDEGLNNGYIFELNPKRRTCELFKENRNKVVDNFFGAKDSLSDYHFDKVEFEHPTYVGDTEGDATIIGTDYHRLLRRETRLVDFEAAMEVLPFVLFEVLNVDNHKSDTTISQRFRSFVDQWGSGTYHGIESNGLFFEIRRDQINIKKI